MSGKILYLDASSGASGDMLLGTMVGLGAPFKEIIRGLGKLKGMPRWKARLGWADRHGIRARRVEVSAAGHAHHEHRSLAQIQKMVRSARPPAGALEGALETFRILARAESEVHGSTVDRVRFHEVGAADAIVDVLGTWLGYDLIGRPRITASPVAVEEGPARGRAAHGAMILPPPATLAVLRGLPVRPQPSETELCTPTGAALLAGLASAFGPMPPMTVERVSYATGKRESPLLPSVLRGILGAPARGGAESDEIVELDTHLDDMSPAALAPVCSDLMEAGALDVVLIPVQMKKGRPGLALKVIAKPGDEARLSRMILENTTTFGLRVSPRRRYLKPREIHTRETAYGAIRSKRGYLAGRLVTDSPEPDDVVSAARRHGVSAHRVYSDLEGGDAPGQHGHSHGHGHSH